MFIDRDAWEAILSLLEQELAATADAIRQDAICCRLALLHWDLFADLDKADAWLLCSRSPSFFALELKRQLFLQHGEASRAATLLEEIVEQGTLDPGSATSFQLESAFLRLFWCRDPQSALATCRRAEAESSANAELRDLHDLALAVTAIEAGPEVYERLVERALLRTDSPATWVQVAVTLWDRFRQAEGAAELIQKALVSDDNDLFLVEVLLEIGSSTDQEQARLLQKKIELLIKHDRRTPEALALAIELIRLLGKLGRTQEAAAWLRLIDPPQLEIENTGVTDPILANPLAWSETLLVLTRRDLAVRMRDAQEVAQAYLRLIHCSRVAAMIRIYRLRAAQILQQCAAEPMAIEALLQSNFEENPADLASFNALEQHRLRQGRMEALCAQYEAVSAPTEERKGLHLHKASILAEAHLKDLTLAAGLRQDGLVFRPDPFGLGDLQRLFRASHAEARLVETYLRQAKITSDTQQAALLFCAVAALHLQADRISEAEAAAGEALSLFPDDPLALALRVFVYRVQGRDGERVALLKTSVDRLSSPDNRAAWYQELANSVTDATAALEYLEKALQCKPGHALTLSALAGLCEKVGRFEPAARWGVQLAEALRSDPLQAADAYLKVGQLYRYQLADSIRAGEAFNQALTCNPQHLPALRELAQTYRDRGDLHAMLSTLQRIMELETDLKIRAALQLDMARTLDRMGGEQDKALEAYAQAVRMDVQALEPRAELEALCRKENRLDFFATLLAELPVNEGLIEKLAHILEELGHQEALCVVKAQLADLATGPLQRADRLYDHARLLETLGRSEEATSRYVQVVSEVPGHQPALRALQRIYRAQERLVELTGALEQELNLFLSPERRIELLIDLARTLEEMGQHEGAAQRLEAAIVLNSTNLEALWTLARLYQTARPLDWARVTKQRADVDLLEKDRSTLYLKAAEVYATHGEDQKAIEAYHLALQHDPGNREAFTLYESFLFHREQWHLLMELYDGALRYLESGGGRAYRPVDLYLRRGQLQLQQLAQPGEASASFLKALEHDPKSESAMKMLEGIFVQQQDWLGLIRAYQHRANLLPQNEIFRLESLRHAARLAMSRLREPVAVALSLWEEIHALDPIDEEALARLEQLYKEGRQFEKLVHLLETRLALSSGDNEIIDIRLRIAGLCEKELEDLERATGAYRGVLAVQEHHEEALKALARIYEATTQWEKCIEVLKSLVLIEADPGERAHHYLKCGSILEIHFANDEQAIKNYEAAIAESPICLPAVHGLRDLYLRQEEWNKAIQTLDLELRLWDEPRERAGILARMAEIRLHHLKDVKKAIEQFEDALAIDAECQPAAFALFQLYYERGDHAKALALSDTLVSRMTKEGALEQRSHFFSRRGQIMASSGHLLAAAENLVLALELWPMNLEALDWLTALCRRSPEVYDFATAFRELEQTYKREGNPTAVGHVLVAAGTLCELAGDVDTALQHYQEAIQTVEQELIPVRSLVELLIRLRKKDEAIAALRAFSDRAASDALKIEALLRLGDIWANVLMNAQEAAGVYREVVAIDPHQAEALSALAQELYLLGQFEDAAATMRVLMERALQEGQEGQARPSDLSRTHHYYGVISLKLGDKVKAVDHFQRALQLDLHNTEAIMALARQLVLAGDREGAKRLLESNIGALVGQGKVPLAVELRRNLVGICLGSGDLAAAAQHLKDLVRSEGKVEDRITLAEICAADEQGIPQALAELQQALAGDSFNLHVLHFLAELYERTGERERTLQVLQVMEVLGWVEENDRRKIRNRRPPNAFTPTAFIDEEVLQVLISPMRDLHVSMLWEALRDPLERLFPLEVKESKPLSGAGIEFEQFQRILVFCQQLFALSPAVWAAENVPGGMVATVDGGGRIVIDRALLHQPTSEVLFLLGRTLGYLCSGRALFSRLAFDDRSLLGELLAGLLLTPEARNDLVLEFRRGLSRKALKKIDEVLVKYQTGLARRDDAQAPARWIADVDRMANACGLLSCDDIGSALRMMARLGGQDMALGPRGEVVIQLIADGPELLRFFLSDTYGFLRRRLFHA